MEVHKPSLSRIIGERCVFQRPRALHLLTIQIAGSATLWSFSQRLASLEPLFQLGQAVYLHAQRRT